MSRKIIHLDLDAFFCAVEEKMDPSLHGKPFAVGGRPEGRGVVTSCSYAARRRGVRSAMPMARAVQLCPELIVVSHSRRKVYGEASRQVMQVLREETEVVEQISIDEAFLDVSELQEDGEAIARRLQDRIRRELNLPCSLGVASNKLVAKIATNVGKTAKGSSDYPNAIMVVPAGKEAEFLSGLPAEALWGVGPKTAERLASLGMQTIGDIAAWPTDDLARRLGRLGRSLARRARGIDERPVATSRRAAKSASHETTFGRDTRDRGQLQKTVQWQCERISQQLKRSEQVGTTVKLKLRWSDYTTITRQVTLGQPTDECEIMVEAANKLLNRNWDGRAAVRLIGVGMSGLQSPARQLSLWEIADLQKRVRLDEAVESLHKRFGKQAVRMGSELK